MYKYLCVCVCVCERERENGQREEKRGVTDKSFYELFCLIVHKDHSHYRHLYCQHIV